MNEVDITVISESTGVVVHGRRCAACRRTIPAGDTFKRTVLKIDGEMLAEVTHSYAPWCAGTEDAQRGE